MAASPAIQQSETILAAILRFFEIARVLVRLNHVARRIVNANHGVMGATAVLRVIDCRARVLIPQSAEWQRIRNQIDAAPIPEKFNAFLSRVEKKKSASVNPQHYRPRSSVMKQNSLMSCPHPRQPTVCLIAKQASGQA
jgi:hypothetical protein